MGPFRSSSTALVTLVLAVACSSPPQPSETPQSVGAVRTTPTPPASPANPYPDVVLTGVVTSVETSAPLEGVTVYLNGRYQATTDASGQYRLEGKLDLGGLLDGDNIVFTRGHGYESTVQYVRATTHNLRLYEARSFAAGTPTSVTVSPGDSLCFNEMQDPTFGDGDYVCRTLHTTAPADGMITIEAVSSSGNHYALEVQARGHTCCFPLDNPTSFLVQSGADITINVELPSKTTASESFVVTATMASSAASRR